MFNIHFTCDQTWVDFTNHIWWEIQSDPRVMKRNSGFINFFIKLNLMKIRNLQSEAINENSRFRFK